MAPTSLGPVSMSASADHTVSIPSATAGKSIFVAVTASATLVLHSTAIAAGWIEETYAVNSVGFGIYRLPGANNAGGTVASLRLTHNGAAFLGGVAWEDDVTGTRTYAGSSPDSGQTTQSPLTTAAQTFTTQGVAYVVFSTVQSATNNTSDVTAFDQGFTEFADSGYLDSGGAQNVRMWVASATGKALTSTPVTATWSDSGIYAFNTSGVLGFATAGGGSSSSGWTWSTTARMG